MTSELYLSVIIPAYNEEKRIKKTLKSISSYLKHQPYSYEILVVNDGSKDKTANVVNDYIKKIPNLRFIDRKKNMGKGYSVKAGMLEARGKTRLFTDADNSTDISHFELMRRYFDNGYDLVIGSRDSKDAKGAKQDKEQPWHKRLLGNAGNLFIQMMAVRGVWDTQAGFKAFRDYSAKEIFSMTKNNRWAFDVEALALSRDLGYKMAIVPLNWINDADSRVSLWAYIKFLFDVVKIRWNLNKCNYSKKKLDMPNNE